MCIRRLPVQCLQFLVHVAISSPDQKKTQFKSLRNLWQQIKLGKGYQINKYEKTGILFYRKFKKVILKWNSFCFFFTILLNINRDFYQQTLNLPKRQPTFHQNMLDFQFFCPNIPQSCFSCEPNNAHHLHPLHNQKIMTN